MRLHGRSHAKNACEHRSNRCWSSRRHDLILPRPRHDDKSSDLPDIHFFPSSRNSEDLTITDRVRSEGASIDRPGGLVNIRQGRNPSCDPERPFVVARVFRHMLGILLCLSLAMNLCAGRALQGLSSVHHRGVSPPRKVRLGRSFTARTPQAARASMMDDRRGLPTLRLLPIPGWIPIPLLEDRNGIDRGTHGYVAHPLRC